MKYIKNLLYLWIDCGLDGLDYSPNFRGRIQLAQMF